MIDRLPVPALADEPTLGARGLFRCMPRGFVADGDNVSLWLSKSSVLPDNKTQHTDDIVTCNYSITVVHADAVCAAVCVHKLLINTICDKSWPQNVNYNIL